MDFSTSARGSWRSKNRSFNQWSTDTGLKVSTICLWAPLPRRRTSSWLKSSSRTSEASSIQISVSSPLGKVMDLSFSVSSSPLKMTLFPLAQLMRRSESLQENSSDSPHFEITWRNRA